MESEKHKYDLDAILGSVGVGNEPLQTNVTAKEIEISMPGGVSSIKLPAPVSFKSVCNSIPPLAPAIVGGILRKGHKMMISSSSKAGKSFLAEELAIAVAHGRMWLGFPCIKGKVLYINDEVDPTSCFHRFKAIYKELELDPNTTDAENLDIWNLRGQELTTKILSFAIQQMEKQYSMVIIDPIYKLFEGSENDQESTAAFCRAIDRIVETGTAVVYVHHHSKGAQGGKSSMDRASGSGVFARDVDALFDLTQLFPGGKEPTAKTDGRTIWRAETTLREFAPVPPIIVSFRYPLHRVENSAEYANYKPRSASSMGGSTRAGQQTAAKETAAERCARKFEAWSKEHGTPPTVKELAEVLGVTEKTARKYLQDQGLVPCPGKKGKRKVA